MDLTYLKQWSEPDGDNDQLFGVRMEVKSLIREYEKSQAKVEAAKVMLPYAEYYYGDHMHGTENGELYQAAKRVFES